LLRRLKASSQYGLVTTNTNLNEQKILPYRPPKENLPQAYNW